mmetsp:Transcript_17316/g.60510  ORF Transcript_17316/g.60510 Transcript_17316/m.60510 type:complete len:475 (-) Transcript_17316:1140-2564(-)
MTGHAETAKGLQCKGSHLLVHVYDQLRDKPRMLASGVAQLSKRDDRRHAHVRVNVAQRRRQIRRRRSGSSADGRCGSAAGTECLRRSGAGGGRGVCTEDPGEGRGVVASIGCGCRHARRRRRRQRRCRGRDGPQRPRGSSPHVRGRVLEQDCDEGRVPGSRCAQGAEGAGGGLAHVGILVSQCRQYAFSHALGRVAAKLAAEFAEGPSCAISYRLGGVAAQRGDQRRALCGPGLPERAQRVRRGLARRGLAGGRPPGATAVAAAGQDHTERGRVWFARVADRAQGLRGRLPHAQPVAAAVVAGRGAEARQGDAPGGLGGGLSEAGQRVRRRDPHMPADIAQCRLQGSMLPLPLLAHISKGLGRLCANEFVDIRPQGGGHPFRQGMPRRAELAEAQHSSLPNDPGNVVRHNVRYRGRQGVQLVVGPTCAQTTCAPDGPAPYFDVGMSEALLHGLMMFECAHPAQTSQCRTCRARV